MPTGETPEVLTAQILCLLLLPVALLAPPRWAVLAWLVMGNLDASGAGPDASTSIGILNALKGVVLPLYLWWRMREAPSQALSSLAAKLWLALILYAGLASLWSPYPLAAVKLVGNMIGILLSVVVLEKASRAGLLQRATLIPLILISLALGVLQTFYYGGAAYGFDGAGQTTRFSSFVWAQQYAAFLVAFLAILLWRHDFQPIVRWILLLLVSAALAMNGSRTWFFGGALVTVVYLCFQARRLLPYLLLGLSSLALALLLGLNLGAALTDPITDTSSRIVATLAALATGQDTAHKVGLANVDFRLAIYRTVTEDIETSDPATMIFGHGTSSGGNILLRLFPSSFKTETLDANRAIHNEWLRALYEWGILGFALVIAAFVALVTQLLARYRTCQRVAQLSALLSFIPAYLLASTTENIIAGAGNAVTLGLALTAAVLCTPGRFPSKHVSKSLRHAPIRRAAVA